MRVVVPFDAAEPKTRLAPVLAEAERPAFARAMLVDVLDALAEAGHRPEVLATAPVSGVDAPVTVDDRPLTPAVNDALDGTDPATAPVAVVMADLPLLTADAFGRLVDPDADVVLAPGIGGGTNAFVTRHPDFRVDYHGVSYRDHRAVAEEVGATTATVDSFRLSLDVDEPADIAEVLLHGDGEARAWLEAAGFELAPDGGRAPVARGDERASGTERS